MIHLLKYTSLLKKNIKVILFSIIISFQAAPTFAAELLTNLGGDSGFGQLAMGRNDDGSSVQIDITQAFPNGWNFFGNIYGTVYINNNGNITFNNSVGTYTPSPFPISSQPMIAPYWGDVDTRGGTPTGESPFSNNVYFSFEKTGSFVVTWFNVGYYSAAVNKLNTFQLVLTDRSDTGNGALGNFDVEFRYERLEWTTGGASGGSNGLGGTPAQVGFDAGDGTNFFAHPASRTAGILDLINTSNVGIDGVWRFEVRDGVVTEPPVLTDVKLKLFIPKDGVTLDQSTFQEPPTSISIIGDEQVIEWQFSAFTVTRLKDLSFDVILNNPLPGERRTISHRMELSYLDVNGNSVVQNIGEKVVDVLPSILNVTVNTDKASYVANEDVSIDSVVSNLSDFDVTTDVRLAVYDVNDVLVEQVQLFPNEIIQASGENTYSPILFNTLNNLVGDYEVRAELIDDSNQVTAIATALFTIQSSDNGAPEASLRLGVDKPVYNTSDQVTIESLSKNITANTIIDGAVVKLKILNPDGSIFAEVQQSIGELASGNQRQENSIQSLSAVPQGIYFVEGELLNASGTVLATDQTQFEVHEDLSLTITGSVAVEQPLVYIRDLQKCNNTINNVGTLDLNQGVFRQVLINVDTQQQVLFSDQVVQVISSGGTYQFITDVDTTDLDVGQYSCVLQRQEGTDWKTLAYDFFTLELGIDIEASADIASSGMRLLVLLDDPNYACLGEDEHDDEDDHDDKKKKKKKHDDDEHDDDSDDDHENNNCQAQLDQEPHGPANAPLLSEQRAVLEGLLNQKSWSYTIVTNASDFTRELRSGTYNAYALLSETIKLDEKVQKELREAVFSGEKLLVVGDHDRRNEKLEDALGIDVHGKSVTPSSLIVDQVEAYVSTTMDFTLLDKSNAIELEGATQVASYNTDLVCSSEDDDDDHEDKHHKKSKKKHDDEDDDHDKKDDDHDDDNECQSSTIAVTHYNYGFGHSVYAGFDLLANAAMPAANTAFSDLLLAALKDLEGNSFALNTSAVVPVSINLNNLGIATPGQVIIPQPANTSFIDPGAAILQADGSLLWVFDLPVDEVKTLTFWLQLPDTANNTGTVDISAQVQAGTTPDLLDLETLQLQLPVLSSPSLQSVLDDLLLLKPEDKNFKKAHKKVEKAKKYQGQGKYEKVLKELLKASDYLAKTDHVAVTDVRKKLAFVIREIERQIP